MRLSTLASAAVLAVSSAALAQVASTPVEQKTSPDNGAGPDNAGTGGLVNNATANNATGDLAPATTPREPKPSTLPRR